jgi:hypothetical protein
MANSGREYLRILILIGFLHTGNISLLATYVQIKAGHLIEFLFSPLLPFMRHLV